MKFNIPMAVFGGLALIAAAIYFGSGSQPVNAAGGVQPIALCNIEGTACASIVSGWTNAGNTSFMSVNIGP
jgi:hypothetical protein